MRRTFSRPLLVALIFTLAADAAIAQPVSSEKSHVAISAGLERAGSFIDIDFRIARHFTVGYSPTLRFDPHPNVDGTPYTFLTEAHAFALGYSPVRWFSAYGGPAVVSVSEEQIAPCGSSRCSSTSERQRVAGAYIGATVRVYQRSFRFYTAGARMVWVPRQAHLASPEASLGVGAGITF